MALLLNANDSVNRSYTITKPSPNHPLDVNGVGVRTSNAMPYATAQTISDNGITVTSDGQGTYHVEGLATADANISLTIPEFTIPVSVGSGGQGTMALFNGKIGSSQGDSRLEFYNGSTRVDSWQLIQANRTSTTYGALMDGKNCNKINIFIKSGVSTNADIKPMFTNDGTLPTTYEPYGYKIPISSGGVTTNIYLGSTQTTRRIKKLVLTGEEDWQVSSSWKKTNTSVFFYYQADIVNAGSTSKIYVISDKFEATSRDGLYNGDTDMIARTGGNAMTIRVSDSIATTAQAFKTWLSENPVTVWYVLQTATTSTVNEPLQKIGDYADTLSNAVSIPTTEGANSITVDTTVQPSEFTATWTGWHNANVKEWDGTEWS